MKTMLCFLASLALIGGCGIAPAVQNAKTPLSPLPSVQTFALSPLASVSLPAAGFLVLPPFIYRRTDLRDCFLESSTDLVHWEERSDFVVTNGQWLVKMDSAKPCEFYRVGCEPLP